MQSSEADAGLKDPAMGVTLTLTSLAFVALFAWLWALRFRVLRLTEAVEELEYLSDEAALT